MVSCHLLQDHYRPGDEHHLRLRLHQRHLARRHGQDQLQPPDLRVRQGQGGQGEVHQDPLQSQREHDPPRGGHQHLPGHQDPQEHGGLREHPQHGVHALLRQVRQGRGQLHLAHLLRLLLRREQRRVRGDRLHAGADAEVPRVLDVCASRGDPLQLRLPLHLQ